VVGAGDVNGGRRIAAVNAPQSKRFAKFADARQSRSVWSARVFSTAFGRGEEFDAKAQGKRESFFASPRRPLKRNQGENG
jgi:hypothetical protein